MWRSFAVLVGFLLVGPSCTNSDNLALLLDTLKPVIRAVCDDEVVSLSCPTGTAISILVAQYGGAPPKEHSCSAAADQMCKLPNKMQYMLLQRVVEVCQKKFNCVFSTNPGPGDPCPTSRKFVQVEYKCRPCALYQNDFPPAVLPADYHGFLGDPSFPYEARFMINSGNFIDLPVGCEPWGIINGTQDFVLTALDDSTIGFAGCTPDLDLIKQPKIEFRSLKSCDDQEVKISCNPHSRITIYDVRYGRIAYESASCPQPQGVPDETCFAPYAVETVMRICHGKRRCHFIANRDTFDVSCKPYSKPYIKVVFACVPLGILTERYESAAENDELDGVEANEDPYDESDGTEKWREPFPVPPYADPALQSPTEVITVSSTVKSVIAVQKTSKENDKGINYNIFVYIGAGIIIILLLILLITAIRCYFTRKEKEHAKNGDMFTTDAPNIFSDAASEMDNDVEVSHISGTFYDPVHPDMILYRDADGTRNTLRAMRPLSTIYPCTGPRMYGNDYAIQREPGRFTRSKSKEEEPTDPELMSPKSLGAYSSSQFYYG